MSDTLFARIGGDPAVRHLVDRFYDHMDVLPEAAAIRAMHPSDLSTSRLHLYWFLSGWLGGPPLFVERRGHPMLRARHLPFAVDASARDAWMLCMDLALAEVVADTEIRVALSVALHRVATHMINHS